MNKRDAVATCELCGEPMPTGETMFKFHGYSGPCPKPPIVRVHRDRVPSKDLAAYANGGWESLGEDTIASMAVELLERRAEDADFERSANKPVVGG